MTDTQHTPGPWKVTVDGWGGGELHLSVFIPDKTQDLEEAFQAAEAVARLIAAAPEMLAACQRALAEAVADDQDGWYAEARAAIAKATGK